MLLSLRSRGFSVPKAGNREDENEDAYRRDDSRGRYALADGATEGSYSRTWAIQLVERYEEEPLLAKGVQELQAWLPRFQDPSVPQSQDAEETGPRPWYLERSRERGSYATLLGVSFTVTDSGAELLPWEAIAVGDSCLFHIRSGRLVGSFPLGNDHDFRDAPTLLSTVPSANAGIADSLRGTRGQLGSGEQLLLATDALAAWIFAEAAVSWLAIDQLLALDDAGAFERLIQAERGEMRMRNDDCSVVIVEALQAAR